MTKGKVHMKHILVFVMMTTCSTLSVAEHNDKESLAPTDRKHDVSDQWGTDALNFPQSLKKQDPESLGLILHIPSLSFEDVNDAEKHSWLESKNNSVYQVASIQTTRLDRNLSGLNASYSNGNFRAETGLLSRSSNLMSSSQFYLQGAYSLFDGEHLNVSLTAKIETVGGNVIDRYHGKENQALSNSSIFEHNATNATLGLLSTYSITKKWKVLGLISSTNLDDKIENSPLLRNDNVHVAMLGTSYSF